MLHWMQGSLVSRKLSVHSSICLSVYCVHCNKTEERSVQIFIPYERSFSLVFWEEKWLSGNDPFYLKFWVGPHWSEIADFQPIFARSISAITLSKKSLINAKRKFTTRFPIGLRYVAPKPPMGAQKRKTTIFGVKLYFTWRKSATKFLCVKTVSDRVVRHSLAYPSMQKWFMGDVPTTWNFGRDWPFQNVTFQSIFAHSTSPVMCSKKKFSELKEEVRYKLSNEPTMTNSVRCP